MRAHPSFERTLAAIANTPSLQPISFEDGETIVERGEFVLRKKTFSYAAVPLTFIKSGAVAIIENGKAIKHLRAGEYFGLFETAHALRFGKSKRVGRWTLVADGATTVVPLSLPELRDASGYIETLALESHVPKPFSRLPLLDRFADAHNAKPVDDTILIYHSHVLESSYDLIKHLAFLFSYQNVFVVEKPYSTIDSAFMKIARTGVMAHAIKVEEHMPYEFSIQRGVDFTWDAVVRHAHRHSIKRIIILSDGGDFPLDVPWDKLHGITVVAVEQTQRGIERIKYGTQTPAVVDVASSLAKKTIEPPYIARAIFEKIKSLGLIGSGRTFGVIGNGAIGNAIAALLDASHEQHLQYDKDRAAMSTAKSLEELVAYSDIIIGTTGTDALRGLFVEKLYGQKIAISASSSNIEFAYLFDLAKTYATKFEDIDLVVGPNLRFKVLNSGYPINFDRTKEWEPLEDVQLTRTLLYAGICQALEMKNPQKNRIHKPSDLFQKQILEMWHTLRT